MFSFLTKFDIITAIYQKPNGELVIIIKHEIFIIDEHSMLRHTNGMPNFFQNGKYFEYNEFTNSLDFSNDINLAKFGIDCPALFLYEQLKLLLTQLLEKNI
ncbi:uncharacterized protein [Euwallacea fornicatus]|uniref:uncharacterized protein n=1 Tax=Euwallacea fornicatus TaxID=995702 RepID=UPI00338E2904